ncbi:hypothetical protein [Hymenobacter cavernae]|uniref:Uncharacterized protein n=1 Tax=Hymenobacter cavernae TaxID=2044852 RepID=A0ABQ1UMD2_9BACT|nr:hypothetical protein [Hymenobacter cavernae]GGF22249.1 hypothetical protein GCM10011383_37350 [Hymenobacter cavernae]
MLSQLEQLQKEHGEISTLTLKDKAGNVKATAYLKQANRPVVARGMSLLAQNKPLEAGEFILENCFVGGDKEVLENELLKMSASMQAVALVELLDGELKKN